MKSTIFNFHTTSIKLDKRYSSLGIFTPIDELENQIKFIKKNYDVVPLSTFFKNINNSKVKLASLTIDDGDMSSFLIAEILDKFNLKATFFINTNFLDNKDLSWIDLLRFIKFDSRFNYLKTEIEEYFSLNIENLISTIRNTMIIDSYKNSTKRIYHYKEEILKEFNKYLSFDDLKYLKKLGHSIQSHMSKHERCIFLTNREIVNQINDSVKILNNFETQKTIAIPFGKKIDISNSQLDLISSKKYIPLMASITNNLSEKFAFDRLPIDGLSPQKIKKLI